MPEALRGGSPWPAPSRPAASELNARPHRYRPRLRVHRAATGREFRVEEQGVVREGQEILTRHVDAHLLEVQHGQVRGDTVENASLRQRLIRAGGTSERV